MTRRSDLPAHLVGSAFRVRDRELHRSSVGRLRARDLQRPFSGVRAIGLDLGSLLDRCRAYEPLLRPREAFSHRTAAELYGLPLPLPQLLPLPRRLPLRDAPASPGEHPPLEVTAGPGSQRARSAGVRGHVSARPLGVRFHLGLPLVGPAVAWCQLASSVRHGDLVALGDALVTGPRTGRVRSPGLATLDELHAASVWWGSRRGARALAAALQHVRTGAESRPETQLRLLLVESGLPEPVPNHPIEVGGGVIHPDLAYLRERIAIEYQGDLHRTDRRRWQQDVRRKRDLEHAGWTVVEVTADDLFVDPRPLIVRLRALLAAVR